MSGFQRWIKACGRSSAEERTRRQRGVAESAFSDHTHHSFPLCERTRVNALLEASAFGSVY